MVEIIEIACSAKRSKEIKMVKKTYILIIVVIIISWYCDKEVINGNPKAIITHKSGKLLRKEIIIFDGSKSTVELGEIIDYQWDFGDGKNATGIIVEHLYENAGSFNLRLTVEDKYGAFDSTIIVLEILPSLKLISEKHINIDEPSGLTLDLDNKALWTVSDKTGRITKLNLNGNVLKTLNFHGSNLEGITINPADNSLWIVEEGLGEIIQIDSIGNELSRHWIPSVRDGAGGLEGITYNITNKHFYALKEKDPGVLLELDDTLSTISYKRIFFADDFSGIDFDANNSELWIVSHQSEKIFRCKLDGEVIEYFAISLPQAEGIAYDADNKLIYIVDDAEEKLYTFTFWE